MESKDDDGDTLLKIICGIADDIKGKLFQEHKSESGISENICLELTDPTLQFSALNLPLTEFMNDFLIPILQITTQNTWTYGTYEWEQFRKTYHEPGSIFISIRWSSPCLIHKSYTIHDWHKYGNNRCSECSQLIHPKQYLDHFHCVYQRCVKGHYINCSNCRKKVEKIE